MGRALRWLVPGAVLVLATACRMAPVRIGETAVPPPDHPQLIDRRPPASLGVRPAVRGVDPVPSYYIAEGDTDPGRMQVLHQRLAGFPFLARPGITVMVEAFDILHDSSGQATGLSLELSGRGLGMLDTTPIGDGVLGYRCTLVAAVDGRTDGVLRQVAYGTYTRGDYDIGVTPAQHQAARQCVERVIDDWAESVRGYGLE